MPCGSFTQLNLLILNAGCERADRRGFRLTELASDRLIADWQAGHPGRTLRWPGYGRAPAEIIQLFLSDLAASHGSVFNYATGQSWHRRRAARSAARAVAQRSPAPVAGRRWLVEPCPGPHTRRPSLLLRTFEAPGRLPRRRASSQLARRARPATKASISLTEKDPVTGVWGLIGWDTFLLTI